MIVNFVYAVADFTYINMHVGRFKNINIEKVDRDK